MLQKLIVRLFPKLAARLEAESRQWLVSCPNCGHEVSVWEVGGIRYKASGTVYRYGRCVSCRQRGMLRVYRPGDPSDTQA